MTVVPPWVLQLCAQIGAADSAAQARDAMWDAFHKIAALPPAEHEIASQMIRDVMRERAD